MKLNSNCFASDGCFIKAAIRSLPIVASIAGSLLGSLASAQLPSYSAAPKLVASSASDHCRYPSISTAGTRLAYLRQPVAGGVSSIWFIANLTVGSPPTSTNISGLQWQDVGYPTTGTQGYIVGEVSRPTISRDGLYVTFWGCENASPFTHAQVFAYSVASGILYRVTSGTTTVSPTWQTAPPTISDAVSSDRYVAYQNPNTPTGILVTNLNGMGTVTASRNSGGTAANNVSDAAAINYDGTKLVFSSTATNLVTSVSGRQLYYATASGGAWTVANATSAVPSYGLSVDANWPVIDKNGTKAAFIGTDTAYPNYQDVYHWSVCGSANPPYNLNTAPPNGTGPVGKHTTFPNISPDGRYVSVISDRDLEPSPLLTNPSTGLNDGLHADYGFVCDSTTSGAVLLSFHQTYPKLGRDGGPIAMSQTANRVIGSFPAVDIIAGNTSGYYELYRWDR